MSAHRTKHAVCAAVTYAMRLIARLIDDTVTSWLSKDTFHYVTTLLAQAIIDIHSILTKECADYAETRATMPLFYVMTILCCGKLVYIM